MPTVCERSEGRLCGQHLYGCGYDRRDRHRLQGRRFGRNLRRASACPDTERYPRDHPLRGADHHQQPCEESLLPGLGSEEGRTKREE